MQQNTSHDLQALAAAFQAWLDAEAASLERFKHEPADFDGKVRLLRELQRALYDAGWARYGWSEALGGQGGSVLHRGVLVDVLERNGFPPAPPLRAPRHPAAGPREVRRPGAARRALPADAPG